MLSYTDLKKGIMFVLDGQPYEVLDSHFLRMQQRKAVVQTKIKNLANGKILDRNWQASDHFEEAEIEKKPAIFIYRKQARTPEAGSPRSAVAERGDECWFHEDGNPANRFCISGVVLGDAAQFLKPQTKVDTVIFDGKVITVKLPVKMEFGVVEAPPAIKGNTAQGGSKVVTLEGGAKVSAPLFVNEGDIVRINTETGEYVERVEKG